MKEYMLGNHISHLFSVGDRVKHAIAARTPAWFEFVQVEWAEHLEHLHNLFYGIIRTHHEEIPEIPNVHKVCVSREKTPAFLHSQSHKIAVLYIRRVEGIKTEKSQPPGKTAEHGIRDETHIMGGFIVHVQQLIAQ